MTSKAGQTASPSPPLQPTSSPTQRPSLETPESGKPVSKVATLPAKEPTAAPVPPATTAPVKPIASAETMPVKATMPSQPNSSLSVEPSPMPHDPSQPSTISTATPATSPGTKTSPATETKSQPPRKPQRSAPSKSKKPTLFRNGARSHKAKRSTRPDDGEVDEGDDEEDEGGDEDEEDQTGGTRRRPATRGRFSQFCSKFFHTFFPLIAHMASVAGVFLFLWVCIGTKPFYVETQKPNGITKILSHLLQTQAVTILSIFLIFLRISLMLWIKVVMDYTRLALRRSKYSPRFIAITSWLPSPRRLLRGGPGMRFSVLLISVISLLIPWVVAQFTDPIILGAVTWEADGSIPTAPGATSKGVIDKRRAWIWFGFQASVWVWALFLVFIFNFGLRPDVRPAMRNRNSEMNRGIEDGKQAIEDETGFRGFGSIL